MNLQVQELDRKSMKISPNKLRMIGKTILTQYYITQWSLEYKDKGKDFLQLFNVQYSLFLFKISSQRE